MSPGDAARILRLTESDVRVAVRWQFLASDYPRACWLTRAEVRRFIGESDPGPANPRGAVGWSSLDLRPFAKRLHPPHISMPTEAL